MIGFDLINIKIKFSFQMNSKEKIWNPCLSKIMKTTDIKLYTCKEKHYQKIISRFFKLYNLQVLNMICDPGIDFWKCIFHHCIICCFLRVCINYMFFLLHVIHVYLWIIFSYIKFDHLYSMHFTIVWCTHIHPYIYYAAQSYKHDLVSSMYFYYLSLFFLHWSYYFPLLYVLFFEIKRHMLRPTDSTRFDCPILWTIFS